MASWKPLDNQPLFSADTMLLLTDGTVMVHELNTPNWHRLTADSTGSYINLIPGCTEGEGRGLRLQKLPELAGC